MNATEPSGTNFNRGTGLLVIEVRQSNPNGDPDAESEPRRLNDDRGLISPVSFKRKLRDIVADKDGDAWQKARNALNLEGEDDQRILRVRTNGKPGHTTERRVKALYGILEMRFRDRPTIAAMTPDVFAGEFWDARIFGNTFLEALEEKDDDKEEGEKKTASKKKDEQRKAREHFISTGVVQFGPGVSIAPVDVIRGTWTNKSGVQEGKDRGMAPLASRVVHHAVYVMPFFVNPCMANRTGCGANDIRLLQRTIPLAYRLTASASRSHVEIVHAWYAEHKSSLGSVSDSLVIDALNPRKVRGDPEEPSTSLADYEVPTKLPPEVLERLASFQDLCEKQWE